MRSPIFIILTSSLLLSHHSTNGQEPSKSQIDFFESKIRPVLIENCYACHSQKSGKSESSLLLDSKMGIRQGGDRGPAVEPGSIDESLLITAITHAEPDLEMPPRKEQLADAIVADFKKWIAMGAPDPRTKDSVGGTKLGTKIDIEKGRKFWSFQPPQRTLPPAVGDPSWPRRELDFFILANLELNKLGASPDAETGTLLRRLSFDLIGLPPSPQEIDQFRTLVAAVGIDTALARKVDSLLESKQFGERWGRHWLDVARFAESSGKETNVPFPQAWRYRDYVIRSFNQDKPFDQFITEQIAGDLLPAETRRQKNELSIATGFLAVGPKGLNEMNGFQFLADLADEQIDTVSRSIMASSVACARCHDHKFDPFATQDYYALAGIFISTKTMFGTSIAPGNNIGGELLTLAQLEDLKVLNKELSLQQVEKFRAELAAVNREEIDRRAAANEGLKQGKRPEEFFSVQDALRIIWRRGSIEGKLKTVFSNGAPRPLSMGVQERAAVVDSPLLARGEISRPGEKIPRGFPQVIQFETEIPIPPNQSGRLQLAQWLVHPQHPLTSRVMVNRIWSHLFGTGLVATVDDFGVTGERPSHPQLLDNLALQFVDSNWSVKSMVRQLVLSRTYRQSSTFRDAAFQIDPENRLLWRVNKRRLDAEAIRDSMLAVAGQLDLEPRRGSLASLLSDRPITLIAFNKKIPADLDGSLHRSVYLPVIRDRLPDVLELFDFAEPSLVTGARDTTNVPIQALYLLNSPFVQQRSTDLASLLAKQSKEKKSQIKKAFLLCFGRHPDSLEVEMGIDFLTQKEIAPSALLESYCQALLCMAEFRNID